MAAPRRGAARRRNVGAGVHESGFRRAHAGGHGPFVLVVDDVEDNREIYASFLAHHGYRVDTAVDGAEALEKIRAEAPDIVLMDLAMPRLDGWEATREIKADETLRHIVVVALTGYAVGDFLRRARVAGADAVLTKPCTPAAVLELLAQLLDR